MFADDETRLKHMVDVSREAIDFCEGKARQDLAKDRKLALALVKCIEIVGEAASGVTELLRKEHPEIPWRAIVATRNRLIHGYFDIDYDRVWDTIKENLPLLVESLEQMISKQGDDDAEV